MEDYFKDINYYRESEIIGQSYFLNICILGITGTKGSSETRALFTIMKLFPCIKLLCRERNRDLILFIDSELRWLTKNIMINGLSNFHKKKIWLHYYLEEIKVKQEIWIKLNLIWSLNYQTKSTMEPMRKKAHVSNTNLLR